MKSNITEMNTGALLKGSGIISCPLLVIAMLTFLVTGFSVACLIITFVIVGISYLGDMDIDPYILKTLIGSFKTAIIGLLVILATTFLAGYVQEEFSL